MYTIKWEDDSTGLRSPTIDGERPCEPWAWLEYAERCNVLEAERDKWRGTARSLAEPLRSLIELVDEGPIWRQWAKDRGVGDANTVQLIECAEGGLAAYDAAVEEAEKCTTPNPT